MAVKLYPYQKIGVKWIHHFKNKVLLADEMGLGKTVQSVQAMKETLRGKGTAIIVCDAGLKYNWESELRDHFNIRSEVLSGITPPDHPGLPNRVYIISYNLLKNWWPWLRAIRPNYLIADEVQAIKNVKAKQTKAFAKLQEGIKHKVFMSGTPLTNGPTELWSAMNMLWPDAFPSFHGFAFRYTNPVKEWYGWRYPGSRNLKELNGILRKKGMIRRLKKDVLKQLPGKTRTVIPVEISHRREYDKAEREFLTWLAMNHGMRKAVNAAKNEKLVQMGYLKRLAAQLKLPAIEAWITEWLDSNPGKKIIVFGIHHEVLKPLYKKFQNISVLVNGEVPPLKRRELELKWKMDSNCQIFFGNIHAAGKGWNGTQAQTVLFAEMDWVPGNHIQAEDRIHRIGQTFGAQIFYMVGRDTIEHKLCEIISEKQKVLDTVLDGVEGVSEMDIQQQLEWCLLQRQKNLIGTFGRKRKS